MPALLTSSSRTGNNNGSLSRRGWWDDVDDWFKDHGWTRPTWPRPGGGNGGGNGGNGGGNGNGGGGGNNNPKPTSTPKPSPKPTPKPSPNTTKNNVAPTKGNSSTKEPSKPTPTPAPAPAPTRTRDLVTSSSSPNPSSQSSQPDPTPPRSGEREQPTTPTPEGVRAGSTSDASPSGTPGAQSNFTPPTSKVNIAAIVVPIVVLLSAFGLIMFFVWRNRRRRNNPPPISLHSNSNTTSTYSFISTPSMAGATAGGGSPHASVIGQNGLLLPPRAPGAAQSGNGQGMQQTGDSRPISMSSSAFNITNPFAERAALVDTPRSGTPWGSEAGYGGLQQPAALRPSNVSHSPSPSASVSIVGSGVFSLASANHGHGSGSSNAPTPASETRPSPFGDNARIAGGPRLSHTRLIFPSTDDITSEDAHVTQYGSALASSVGHGLHHDDGRSMVSYAQTPTSLFFRLSQDMRHSLALSTEMPPPLPPKPVLSSMSPATPNSAAPLLGGVERAASPVWIHRGAAPSPPPSGPLPSPPAHTSTFGRGTVVPSSPLAPSTNEAYDGLSDVGSDQTVLQHASRVPVQAPVLMKAPPVRAVQEQNSYDSFDALRLQRSPSVLTTGSRLED